MFHKHKEAIKDSPKWMLNNIHYEVLMGSHAYGCHDKNSDKDIYGFCIPPKELIFPHQLSGYIDGFGSKPQRFEQFNKCYDDADFSIYNIVKYFDLCMGCNPNMIDSLFVPDNCVLHITTIGHMVRDNRHLFLCKKAWHTFKGYGYSQLKKLKIKDPNSGKRKDYIEKFGMDVKFAYHIVRLIDEVEQILTLGDIDLQRDRERLKSIRRGEWDLNRIEQFFYEKEKSLEKNYEESKLPYHPREIEIKNLLLNCLEHHYGSLDNVIKKDNMSNQILNDIQELLNKYQSGEQKLWQLSL